MSEKLSLIETIEKEGMFSVFARLLRTSKAVDLIAGEGPFTVFAPTNDAFGNVPDKQMNGWISQPGQTNLAKVLSHHIVPAWLYSSKLSSKNPVDSLFGSELSFSDHDGLKVNESGVLGRDKEATNGVVHALDTVLTPPTTAKLATAATAGTEANSNAAPTDGSQAPERTSTLL